MVCTFFDVYGDKWTDLWYPQICENVFFALISVIGYMKMTPAPAEVALPTSNPRLSVAATP